MNPWGAIIAALIAGFIAFIGMVITKENKISEFRQEWIKELRSLIAKLYYLYGFIRLDSALNPKERKEKNNEINEVIANINLHLNHGNKSPHEEKLQEAITMLNGKVESGETKMTPYFDELLKCSHLVLKEEWERVKKGEKSYIFIKDVLFVIGFFSLALLMLSMIIYAISHSGILLLSK
ncbi:hypothetical protein ACKVM9_002431 [Pantoea agglomerans]|uniref:hypothetical protein n=1 Tax=Enterobacter agglomerans TaxID=549 RepID=UPI00278CC36E|nr:hypothetical protein [Pantoea agglomerans]MDQ0548209.1 hypothetical protein [Pantoea agglomerans]